MRGIGIIRHTNNEATVRHHIERSAELSSELMRVRSQVSEAISILENGTDYEKTHVPAILSEALG